MRCALSLASFCLSFVIAASVFSRPLVFEPNAGQTDPRVRFLARGSTATYFITDDEIVVGARGDAIRLVLLGSRPAAGVERLEPLEQRVNVYRGNPSAWLSGVPTFGRIIQRERYPKIDAAYYGAEGALEIDWIVAPEGDPSRIRFALLDRNGKRLQPLLEDGALVLRRGGGAFRIGIPTIRQGDETIRGSYVVKKGPRGPYISLKLANYDASKPLVIDPVLTYSTFLGGMASENSPTGAGQPRVAVDAAGNIYVAASTDSDDFPLRDAAYATRGGNHDGFVTKFVPSGASVVYSTYFGGAGQDDPTALAVDSAGNAYVAGVTSSSNFPTTEGAPIRSLPGGGDSFVVKLDAAGALVYGTYLGGPTNEFGGAGKDEARGITADVDGNAYVVGVSESAGFPITAGALITSNPNPPWGAAFVTKLNATGTSFLYSTFLCATSYDNGSAEAMDVEIDSQRNIFVLGKTNSGNFPTTVGAHNRTSSGPADIFVAKIAAAGDSLMYSTLFGGGATGTYGIELGSETPRALAIDSAGNAYFTGWTDADNFPVTTGAYQTARGDSGFPSAFVTKLNATGSALEYSTYFSGPGTTYAYGIAVDGSGNASIAGVGGAFPNGIPVTADALHPVPHAPCYFDDSCNDGFVATINATGTALQFSTILGGFGAEKANDIAIDTAGSLYVVGTTRSANFPTVSPFQRSYAGNYDVFVSRFSSTTPSAGSLRFSAATYSASESAGSTEIPVIRDGGTAGKITVDYATSNHGFDSATASDITPTSGTLVFATGETSKIITVPLLRDSVVEAAEPFAITLTNATGRAALGGPSHAVVTLLDAPAIIIELAQPSRQLLESVGSTTFTVTRYGDKTPSVAVDYRIDAGTAEAGSDYTNIGGTLTFAANETTKELTLQIANDASLEPNETLTLVLFAPTGGSSLGTPSSTAVTIIDDDAAGQIRFTRSEYVVDESATNVLIEIERVGGTAGDVRFSYATADGTASNGADYTAASSTLDFPSGGFTRSFFYVSLLNEPVARTEGPETFTVSLQIVSGNATLGPPSTATVRIEDDQLIRTAPLVVARTGEWEAVHDVAFDGTNFLLAMEGPRGFSSTDPQAAKILAQFVSESEALVGPPVEVGRSGYEPRVAFDGTYHLLVWDDAEDRIHGQLIAKNGTVVGMPFPISNAPGPDDDVMTPTVAFGGGNYLVAWGTMSGPSLGVVRGAVVAPNGSIVAGDMALSDNPGRWPDLASDGTNFLLAWDQNDAVFAQRLAPTGAKIGSAFDTQLDADGDGAGSHLAFGNGVYFLASMSSTSLFGTLTSSEGVAIGSPFEICSCADADAPSVAFDGNRFFVTWSEGLQTDARIRGRFFNRLGAAVTESFVVFDEPGSPLGSPTAFGTSKFIVAYNSVNLPGGAVSDVSAVFVRALTIVSGDATGDNTISVSDIFYLINTHFAGGPGAAGSGDANGDGESNVADIFYMINYIFAAGPPPV